jgi:hypothetical protein
MKPAYEVIERYVKAQRDCKAASDQLDACLKLRREAEEEAIEVFEANGWPRAVRFAPGICVVREGTEHSPLLAIWDESLLVNAADLTPLRADKAGRFAIRSKAGWSQGKFVGKGCSNDGYVYVDGPSSAETWPTYTIAVKAAMDMSIPCFTIVDLDTMAEESAIPEARRARR